MTYFLKSFCIEITKFSVISSYSESNFEKFGGGFNFIVEISVMLSLYERISSADPGDENRSAFV